MSEKKNIDRIVEVEKFNPFHDGMGRFSSSSGFKTYSANPNTKAGAMAIARSAAGGHGNTVNVHRESYGENIRQNANWIGRGKQQSSRQQANATLRTRIEPATGLAGASRAGAIWQQQNQAQGRTTGGNKAQQQQQKPTQQQKPAQPAQQQQKPAQQQQKPAAQNANTRTPVDGKDISGTFKYNSGAKGDPLDQVAEQQGYKGKPQLIQDRAQFSAAVKASGMIAYRTITPGTDTVTGKRKTGAQFADDLKNSDAFSHNGTGGKLYGAGIYIAATQNAVRGTAPSRSSSAAAKSDSRMYGSSTGSATLAMTLHPSAKVGDYNTVQSQFRRLPSSQRARFGNDMAAFAASKGFDALRAVDAGWGCDYITVYNRSKLVIFDN